MMKGRLAGKLALVTAAANGIGRETSLAFAREGATVIATDVDPAGLETLTAEVSSIETQQLDVTEAEAVHRLLGNRAVDVLFNCAGWVHQGSIEECDTAAWRRSFSLNVDSMFFTCRAVIPGMLRAGGGSIINMSSVVSSVKAAPNRFAYGTTKAAVVGLTKSIAADYATRGIRCNAVCPGTIDTPSLHGRVAALKGERNQVWQQFIARQPIGRLGTAHEVAALVVYLASDESAFTTGSLFVIDGGWSNSN